MSEYNGGNDALTRQFVNLFLVVLLLGIWWLLYKNLDDEFRHLWRYIRISELYAWKVLAFPLHLVGLGLTPEQLQEQINFLLRPPGGNVTKEAVATLNRGWGQYWAPWVSLFFIYKGWGLIVRKRSTRMPSTMEGLLKYFAKINPRIKYFVDNNPFDHPVDYRPFKDNRFAQRVKPWDFVRMSPPPLIDTESDQRYHQLGPIFDPNRPRDKRFDYELCSMVLEKQMGQRTVGKRTFSIMSDTERRVFKTLVKGIYGGKKKADRIVVNHAYIRTALLELAFNSSVEMAELQWVKYEDRTLFFCLQDCGMEVCSAESSGPWFHWQAERYTGKPIPQPAIDLAVEGFATMCDVGEAQLQEYLKEEETFRQDPDYWLNQRAESIKESEKAS